MDLIRAENLFFSYDVHGQSTSILTDISLAIRSGEFVAIRGPSGSGKSTLFYILGCMLRAKSGRLWIDGTDVSRLSDEGLAYLRNQKIGFVFQQFHLLSRATTLDNILLPTVYAGECSIPSEEKRDSAISIATKLGLEQHLRHFPNQLSGGQQQRVAIARALVNNVDLILADEPTGNLDSASADTILAELRRLNAQGKTIVLITHDPEVAKQCSRTIELRDGRLVRPQALPSWEVPKMDTVRPPSTSLWRLIRSVFPLALENLGRSRIRTFLTLVGVVIGVAAVLSMITVGQFAKEKILQSYEDLGVNKLMIRGWENHRLSATEVTAVNFRFFDLKRDILPMTRVFPQITHFSPVLNSWGNAVTYGGTTITQDVMSLGVNENYVRISNRSLELGRNFTPYHVEDHSSVCIIGSEIAQKLFHSSSPLDKILFMAGNGRDSFPCRVIGVLSPQPSNKDWRKPNLDVLLPYTYFAASYNPWEGELHQVAVELAPGSDAEKVSRGVQAFFKRKYGKSGEFISDSDAILIAQMNKFLSLFTIMLASIALIALGVGGMGINNMMLVSLGERFKELGLRKAIGATHRSVRIQLLVESVLLSVIAGAIGFGLGFVTYEAIILATSKFISKITFAWVFDPFAIVISVASMLLVGIASGITPALKAERLEVIEALRSE